MADDDSYAYLRLTQFLDLESHWLSASSRNELCHRICRTAALLLDTPTVAISLGGREETDTIVAAEGEWSHNPASESMRAGLLRAARTSGTPQLKSKGEECLGIFPFEVNGQLVGCLHVRLPRPLFRGIEISFLRFLASLSALVIKAWTPSAGDAQVRTPLAESAVRRYVAMAVHDLRNPLNVVAGYAALLDEETLGALNAQQREAVDAIRRQARVLLSSVEQLIELERMQRGAADISVSHFNLRDLFQSLRATCFAHCADRVRWPGAEAAFEFDCDRRRFFSIAQNLIDNALKHTHGGEIVIDCTRSDGQLLLNVRDQGAGLDPELRANLIQHARTGAEPAPRSGLGLYTVASHVHALGGEIGIENAEPNGTNITVKIPAAAAPARNGSASHEPPEAQRVEPTENAAERKTAGWFRSR